MSERLQTSAEGPRWYDPLLCRVGAWLLLAAGVSHSIGKRDAAATEAFRDALERHPGSRLARLLLGDSLKRQGLWQEAAEVYSDLIEHEPEYENAYYHRACCLLELKRHDEAAQDCLRAIELYPNHAAACAVLGQARSAQGRAEEAVAALERAVELKPGERQVRGLLSRERERLQEGGPSRHEPSDTP